MPLLRIVFILILLMLVGVFAMQNSAIVVIKVFFWEATISRALLILICVGFGAVGTIIALLPAMVRKKNRYK